VEYNASVNNPRASKLVLNSRGTPRVAAARAGILGLVIGIVGPGAAHADSVSGVCPDGSIFVVATKAAAPCARPKFVPASELPPLRPQYLPKPYTWYVDQEERDENNPYNLVDRAQQMRALRSGARASESSGPETSETSIQPTRAQSTPIGVEAVNAPTVGVDPGIELDPNELRDLVQLISVRQSIAPAVMLVEDVRGATDLQIKLAYSPAFERRVLEALGANQTSGRVIAFAVRSERSTEFYPRFFVTQDGESFRPQSDERRELGFILGSAGPMEAGLLSLGYFVIPERFDVTRPMVFWWNDRQLEAVLEPTEP